MTYNDGIKIDDKTDLSSKADTTFTKYIKMTYNGIVIDDHIFKLICNLFLFSQLNVRCFVSSNFLPQNSQ